MFTEIHDKGVSMAESVTWRVNLKDAIGEPRVEFFRLNANHPEYSCLIASYHLSSLVGGSDQSPMFPDASHPEMSLSTAGVHLVRQWLRQTARR